MKAFAFALAAAAPALAILEREKHLLSPPPPPLAGRLPAAAAELDRRQLNGTEPLESSLAITRTATATATGTPRATGSSRTGTATAPGPSATGTGDACSLFNASVAGTLFTHDEIRACFALIPLDEQVKANTLEVVEKMYEQSIFELNQRNTPAPLTQQVDVRAELARIKAQSYETDFAFSRDLSRVMDSLNDGHYYFSDCFGSAFVSFNPFPPVSFVSDPTSTDQGKVYVANDAESIMDQYDEYFYIKDYYNGLGLDAAFLAGKEITAIDGKAPWDRIDEIANESGTYQSLQARRTNALAGRSLVGVESARTLGSVAQQTWPDRDNVTYTIGGQDYVIPYVARRTSDYQYTSAASFKRNNCLAAGTSSSNAGSFAAKPPLTAAQRNPLALFPEEVELVAERGWRGQIHEKRQSSSSQCDRSRGPYVVTPRDPRSSATYIGGSDIQFFVLPANGSNAKPVGVVWLATFSPSTGCTNQFLTDTNAGFRNFTRAGVEKIIIDTTGNGGGSIALSMVWQSFFAPSNLVGDINFSGVMRDTPLARKCLNAHLTGAGKTRSSAGYYGPSNFRSQDGRALTSSSGNYFSNGYNISIDGGQLPVSNILRDSLPTTYLATTTFNPANVVIFGDGLCGSACATFTNYLVRYLNVQTVVVHPRPGEKTEFQQFEAGQALTSTGIYTELEIDNLETDTDAPPPMIAEAVVGFSWRGHLVPGTTDQFIQYSSSPAGSTIGMTQAFYEDPVAMWTYIANSGPLSASPKLATTGQGVGGGSAAGTSGGSTTSGGSGGNPGSAGFARLRGVEASFAIGAVALAVGLL